MDRKKFLKNSFGLAGIAVAAPVLLRSEIFHEEMLPEKSSQKCFNLQCNQFGNRGPFPTHTPSSLVQTNIVGDRTGVAFTMNIYIKIPTETVLPIKEFW
jgi:hypothetical protein